MTKEQAMTMTEELRELSGNDKAFMDLVGEIGITVFSYPAFKAYLAAKKGKKNEGERKFKKDSADSARRGRIQEIPNGQAQ